MHWKTRFAGLLSAATLALGTILVPLSAPAALASNDPILVCQQTTDGTKSTYSFPTDCDTTVTSLIPSGYDSLVIDMTARCQSTSAYTLGMKINFNGDFGTNYDSDIYPENGTEVVNNNIGYMDVTDLTCSKSPTPDDAVTGIELIIPYATSTVFHKQLISHSHVVAYSTGLGGLTQWDEAGGGTWHRASIGAVNRIDFRTSTGNFDSGTTFDIFAQ